MPKFPLGLVAISGVLLCIATGTIAQTAAPPNVPVSVYCDAAKTKTWRVSYLNKINESGDAEYLSGDGKLAARLSVGRVVFTD